MKLFRKRAAHVEAVKTAVADVAATPAPRRPRLQVAPIAMSAEQKQLLHKPVDPRVERIMQEIYADRAAAERALKSRRIIDFPIGDSGERCVMQDERGFWRIVPVAAQTNSAQLGDCL